jgi:hypothetical protein
MAAPSETYVDPSIAANSGTGTIGDPYGDLQYALDTMTRDATNGDRINIKSGTAEVLTGSIDLTSYGTTSFTAPIIFSGYTSAAGDGGKGEIDGNSNAVYNNTGGENTFWIDLILGNSGSNTVLTMDRFAAVIRCEVYGSTTHGILFAGGYGQAVQCWVHNIGNVGVYSNQTNSTVLGCYFSNDGTHTLGQAVRQNTVSSTTAVINSFFNLDSTSSGVGLPNWGQAQVVGNSFLTSGSGKAVASSSLGSAPVTNNLIEGFSEGIDTFNGGTQGVLAVCNHNSFFNCTTDITSDNEIVFSQGNESLVSSPFAKTGSLPTDFTSATFWDDVYAYFAPVDIGNVYSGFPAGANQTKGAVGQPVYSPTYSLHPLAYN